MRKMILYSLLKFSFYSVDIYREKWMGLLAAQFERLFNLSLFLLLYFIRLKLKNK